MSRVIPIRTRHDAASSVGSGPVLDVPETSRLIAPPGHARIAGPCRVSGCRRIGRAGDGLCGRHGALWEQERGSAGPELGAWVATVAGGPLPCQVHDCLYGRSRKGLCAGHHRHWQSGSESNVDTWLESATVDPGEHSYCLIRGCRLWASSWDGFCVAHALRFHLSRSPHAEVDLRHLPARALRAVRLEEVDAFIRAEQERNDARTGVDLVGLAPQLRAELAFLFAAYLEGGSRRVTLSSWALLADRLAVSQLASLTGQPADSWIADLSLGRHSEAKTILRWGCDHLERLHYGDGWEHEYHRDVWRLDRLGYGGHGHAAIWFDRISQPWLRALGKQWTRHRLCTGIAPGGGSLGVRALSALSVHLSSMKTPPKGPGDLTHDMVQAWVSGLAGSALAASTRMGLIGQVSVFLREVHRRGWAPDLPATTMVFPEDFPARPPRTARGLSEHVMAQLETTEALSRLPERHRLVVEILIRCGLRTSDALGGVNFSV